jgi:hypothetical protein
MSQFLELFRPKHLTQQQQVAKSNSPADAAYADGVVCPTAAAAAAAAAGYTEHASPGNLSFFAAVSSSC